MSRVKTALTPFASFFKHDVMWGEMDALGHVNNTCYLRWMEEARLQYMHKAAALQGEQQDTTQAAEGQPRNNNNTNFVLASVTLHYKRPVGGCSCGFPSHMHAHTEKHTHSHNATTVYPASVYVNVRTTRVGNSSFDQECVVSGRP